MGYAQFTQDLLILIHVVKMMSHILVKTEDIGSRSPAESEGSDEEEKDVDSMNAEKASK